MSAITPLRFTPTIVVCVGEHGRAVGEHLAVLLPALDTSRRAGVAMIGVDVEDDDSLSGQWFEPEPADVLRRHQAASAGGATAGSPGAGSAAQAHQQAESRPLDEILLAAVRGESPRSLPKGRKPHAGVLSNVVLHRVETDGVADVPSNRVAIWVVAEVASSSLLDIVTSIRDTLQSHNIACLGIFLSLIYDFDSSSLSKQDYDRTCADQPWARLLNGTGSAALATYAYIFDRQAEDASWWQPDDVLYAAAEAIFVITAAGFTLAYSFQQSLAHEAPTHNQPAYVHIGGLGPCRLAFPRPEAEAYCASRLAGTLMHEWRPEKLEGGARNAPRDNRPESAAAFVGRLRKKITPNPQLKRGGWPAPPLSVEAFGRGRKSDGGNIFTHFDGRDVYRLVNAQRELPAALVIQNAKAEDGFTQWRDQVRGRWSAYQIEQNRIIVTETNQLVLGGAGGIEEARIYVENLNMLFIKERERLASDRERREIRYGNFLDNLFERYANGPWAADALQRTANPSQPQGQGQDYATLGTLPLNQAGAQVGAAVQSAAPGTGAATGGGNAPEEASEETIFELLSACYKWRKRNLPPIPAIAGSAVAMAPVGDMLARQLLPAVWFANGLTLPAVILADTALFGLGAWGYYRWHLRQLQEVEDDLFKFFKRKFANRCEGYEDLRRQALLAELHNQVRRMLGPLSHWDEYVESISERLHEEATSIETGLFEGPVGHRDVLIANRRRLLPNDYTLEKFEADVRTRRENSHERGYEWHHSTHAILPHLINHLRSGDDPISLIGGSLDEVMRAIQAFCLEIVRRYLTGDLVDLAGALDAQPRDESLQMFETLVSRSVILYRPASAALQTQLFVAARTDHFATIAHALPQRSELHMAEKSAIPNTEWLATLRLGTEYGAPSFWGAGTGASPARPQHTHPRWTMPPNGMPIPPYGTPSSGMPPYGTPSSGMPPYGSPPNGTPPYGAPPNSSPPTGPYSGAPSGQPSYNAAPSNQPPYNAAPPSGPFTGPYTGGVPSQPPYNGPSSQPYTGNTFEGLDGAGLPFTADPHNGAPDPDSAAFGPDAIANLWSSVDPYASQGPEGFAAPGEVSGANPFAEAPDLYVSYDPMTPHPDVTDPDDDSSRGGPFGNGAGPLPM